MNNDANVPNKVAIIAAYVFSLQPLTSNKERTVNKTTARPHIHNKFIFELTDMSKANDKRIIFIAKLQPANKPCFLPTKRSVTINIQVTITIYLSRLTPVISPVNTV